MYFGKKSKPNTRYVGPFDIIEKISERAHWLALSPALSKVQGMFHVSMLKKYLHDSFHVLSYESLEVDPKLTYEERLVKILDQKERELCNKIVQLVKVL